MEELLDNNGKLQIIDGELEKVINKRKEKMNGAAEGLLEASAATLRARDGGETPVCHPTAQVQDHAL